MVRSASSGEKVAARLSPPDSIRTRSRSGNFFCICATAARLMEASSRMAVCGQPPVSTPSIRSAGRAPEIFGVPLGIDVVGDGCDLVALAQLLAQRIHERRLARSDRPAHPHPQWTMWIGHDRNNRVYWVS